MKKAISLIIGLLMLSFTVSCSKDNNPLTYRYDYDLSEYIELGEYKGLPATGYRFEITDEDIQNQIYATLSYYAEAVNVEDRGAKLGDTVYIDYTGTIDGEKFDGGSETNCELNLGGGTFIDGFEEGIVGLRVGESVSLDLTFPSPYKTNPDLSGMDVHFEITVNRILDQKLPEYTDDFARAYLGFDSTEAFENNLREKLASHYKSIYYKYVIEQTWNTVIESTVVKKFPEKELKESYESYISSAKAVAEYQNMKFADYLGVYYKMNEDEFYNYAQEMAEKNTKEEMICYAIARAENVAISDEEYKTRATEYALDVYELASLEAFEKIYDRETILEILLFDIAHEKVADYADMTYID